VGIKNIIIILVMLIVLSASASAYWAIVNIEFSNLTSQAGKPVMLVNPVMKIWNFKTSACVNCNNLSGPQYLGLRSSPQQGSTISTNLIDLTNGTEYYATIEAAGVCLDLGETEFNNCWGWCTSDTKTNAKKYTKNFVPFLTETQMQTFFGGPCNIHRGSPDNPVLPTLDGPTEPPRLALGENKNIRFVAP